MAVVVVDEGELGVVVLAAPLDRLGDIAVCCDFSVGGVGVGGAEVAVLAEDFADVLGEIPAVGVPGAVFADGQGARGNGLSRVPGEEPQAGVAGAGEVATCELQVTAVDVALMKRDAAIRCHLFGGAASVGVVAAFDDCAAIGAGEAHGAVFCIVLHTPDTGSGLDQRLVAIGIEGGGEIAHGGVLVKVVGCVCRHFLTLGGCVSIADIVVGVAVVDAIGRGACQLGTGVMHEAIVHRLAVAGGAAGERATERVVGVRALRYKGVAAKVSHPDEQVALCFVALRERHVAGHGERLQQITAGQVGVAKLFFRAAVQEACGGDAPIRAVAGGDGMLHRAVLGVGEAGGAPHGIARLGDEVGDVICQQGIGFLLAVGVVADGACAGIIRHLRELPEVMVGVAEGGKSEISQPH